MTGRAWMLVVGLVVACSDEVETSSQRGVPGKGAQKGDKKPSRRNAKSEPEAIEDGQDVGAEALPQRPRPVLTREDFSNLTRDPFQSFLGTQIVEVEPDRPRAQRDVKLAEYNFEDLKLIAIVRSGRGVVPRALFLASDGKSQPVHQGEYFSRAEVLLAAVNRDYIEIEVVDEALASGLHMARGERRAIYLKNE